MGELYDDFSHLFKKESDILFGISDIDFSELKSSYKCALVFAVPHSELIGIKDYEERKFEDLISGAQKRIDMLLKEATAILQKHRINYYIPPAVQSDEEELIAPFSFKFAGVNAGLGWIGKNGVLITEKYGPRVRLSAILIDYNLPKGNPVTKSRCPEACGICVNTCPYRALKGLQWNTDIKREQLIDYKLCNQKRSMFIKAHGRKNSCGLCMVSCPVGINK